MTDVLLPSDRASAARAQQVTQTTAVEQARATAEVQAAVLVAQSVPRDTARALGEMRDSCARTGLAERAFYKVTNRGSGPSVHLARELARIWGNIDYGVVELRRDDEAGESEIRAYAWDQQTNVRSVRSFIVPHQRMASGKRKPLTDLGDVYLNNQNIGARAVRECIFTVLPTWFVDEAQGRCMATLEVGDGEPLEERVAKMIAVFKAIGVDQSRLESKLGAKKGQWSAAMVADMGVTYKSIQRRETTIDDEFPAPTIGVAEITGAPATSLLDGAQ